MLLARSSTCIFPVLLPKRDSFGKVGLFSVEVVDKSELLSVDPLSDDIESVFSSVDPLSDDIESVFSSVDPLSEAKLFSLNSLSDVPSLLSVDPLAYMIAEVG